MTSRLTSRFAANLVSTGISAIPQVLASAQSLLIGVLVARSATIVEFGGFGIAFALWATAVGAVRSLTSEVYVFHVAHSDRSVASASEPFSAALLLSAFGILPLLAAQFAFAELSGQLVWLALSLPIFVLQDATRVLLTALGRAGTASILDGVLVGVMVGGLFIVPAELPALAIQSGWTVATGTVGVVGWATLRAGYSLRAAKAWFQSRNGLTRYLSDFLLTNSLMPIATIASAMVGGLGAAAALRAAQMVVAPVAILSRGVLIAAAAPARRAADRADTQRVRKIAFLMSLLLSLMTALLGLAILLMPRDLLEVFFGETAGLVHGVLLPALVSSFALGVAMGAGLGLRALHAIGAAVLAKAISYPVALTCLVLGALAMGGAGALWGVAVGETLRAFLSWLGLMRRSRGEQSVTSGGQE